MNFDIPYVCTAVFDDYVEIFTNQPEEKMIEVIIDLNNLKLKPQYINWNELVRDKLEEAGIPVVEKVTNGTFVKSGTLRRFAEENNRALIKYTWEADHIIQVKASPPK